MDSNDTINPQQQRIIITARSLFFQQGFKGASMDELARELGMSKKTLYTHFPSKEALVEAVLEMNMRELLPLILALVNSDQRPDQKLEEMAAIAIRRFPQLISPVMIADLQKYYPHLWQKIDRARAQVILQYSKVIEDGRQAGIFRDDLDSETVTMIILHTIQGIINPEYISGSRLSIPELIETIFSVLTRGILSPNYKRREKS